MSSMCKGWLMNDTGKYVTVRNEKGNLNLCAQELQENVVDQHGVLILTKAINTNKAMAFKFQHNDDNFILGVDEGHLKLEKKNNPSDSNWFEKIDTKGGPFYGLKSVVEPEKCPYVATRQDKGLTVLCLQKEPSQFTNIVASG